MKIKTKTSTYKSVMAIEKKERKKPKRPNPFFRTLLCVLSWPTLKKVHFSLEKKGMEKLGKHESALFLMNHSSFIDLKIASCILYPRPFNIICEADGFVGKEGLMRAIGCVPTHKFVAETALVKDMMYAVRNLNNSILLYPEASYSFDETTPTPLPESLGKMIKLLKVPVVMIETFGAFHRDPLYNRLQIRKVDVSAKMEYLLSPEDTAKMSVDEINDLLKPRFAFDHFKWQKDNGIKISENFRADGLSSVLYKCPHCLKEGEMEASGTSLKCISCSKEWKLEEDGSLKALDGEDIYTSIPSWSKWEREEVEREIDEGRYKVDVRVKILLQRDYSAIYDIGNGRLTHSLDGFHLTTEDKELDFRRHPLDNYSVASDLYWYEKGDMISIGDTDKVFYCFPIEKCDVAAKVRMATEYIYRKANEELKQGKIAK
ncbi:MAG: lysophospholipid acyltransferase family protein [Candidatus Ornithospirochaeta sp.]